MRSRSWYKYQSALKILAEVQKQSVVKILGKGRVRGINTRVL